MTSARREAGAQCPAPASPSPTGSPRKPDPRPARRRGRLFGLPALALLLAALGTLAAAPAQAAPTELWSATLTVKALADDDFGCNNASSTAANKCSASATLSDDDFDAGGTTFSVTRVELQDGNLFFGLDKNANAALEAFYVCVGTTSFSLVAGFSSYTFEGAGLTWAAGNSISLKIASACAAPGAVSNLNVVRGVRKLDLSWTPPAADQVTGYDVQFSTEEDITWVDAGHTGSWIFAEITGLTPLTLYYVRVRAVNDAGDGPWSTNISDYPLPEPHGPLLTPDFDLLIGLKFYDGVRDLAIMPVAAGDLTGLGGPGRYYVYLPPGVRRVRVTPIWTNTRIDNLTSNVQFLSLSPVGFGGIFNWGSAESGVGKWIPVMPSSRPVDGMTELNLIPQGSGISIDIDTDYTIYLQHHNGWKSANDRLDALALEIGN